MTSMIGEIMASTYTRGESEESAYLFPVGLLRGSMCEKRAGQYGVRVGRNLITLTPDEFTVWATAHGVLPDVRARTWSRDVVERTSPGVSGSTAVIIERMISLGALVEVAVSAESEIEFARKHRVFPLMLGLGNTPTTPWMYRIGMPYGVASSVLQDIYELWDSQHLGENLWHACQSLARNAQRTGGDLDFESEVGSADDLLHDFLSELHGLLAVNCIYIDVA